VTEAHLTAGGYQDVEGSPAAATKEGGVGAALRSKWAFEPTFEVQEMTKLLDHDNHDMRQRFRSFAKHPLFLLQNNISLEKEREVALQSTPCYSHWCASAPPHRGGVPFVPPFPFRHQGCN
jgi:hypothetical protein